MSANQTVAAQEQIDGGVYLALTGDIDLSRSPQLRQCLLEIARTKPGRLIIDLEKVPYMDSSGVATLVEALQSLRKSGGKMILCSLQTKVRSIFEIARLDMVFKIVADRQAALSA